MVPTAIAPMAHDRWVKILTQREREVAALVSRGLSNKEIARLLGLSCGTIKLHVHSILQKSGANSRYSLIAEAKILDRLEFIEPGNDGASQLEVRGD
jgi:two-component system, NarL family, nitrate/nitrite response regulator NarL